jgi:hypothetical protein
MGDYRRYTHINLACGTIPLPSGYVRARLPIAGCAKAVTVPIRLQPSPCAAGSAAARVPCEEVNGGPVLQGHPSRERVGERCLAPFQGLQVLGADIQPG